jgi:hypothetical protein
LISFSDLTTGTHLLASASTTSIPASSAPSQRISAPRDNLCS